MFAQIFNSAKRILSRSPSVQEASSEPRNTSPPKIASAHSLEVTMVTTRRGTETPGQEPTSTPRSGSARKTVGKRELDALDTPTATKRQKRTTPNKATPKKVTPKKITPKKVAVEDTVLDSAEDTSDTIAITISDVPISAAGGKLPIRRRSSPMVVVGKLSPVESTATEDGETTPIATQETVFHTPEQQTESPFATPATQKKTAGSPTPRTRRTSERTSAKKPSARKNEKAVEVEETLVDVPPSQSSFPDEIPSSTFNSEQASISSQDASLTPVQPKKAHMRFGSEDPEDFAPTPKLTAAPVPVAQDDDDSASDSDEAPDVVTTTAAASKAAANHHDTARALLAQQEKERAQRDARGQRIAAEQAAARLRADKKAKKHAKNLARQQAHTVEPTVEPAAPVDLAGLLPTSLLDAIPDQRAPTPELAHGKTEEQRRKEKLNHHVKFLERSEEGVKDVKRGRVSVAVLGKMNGVLPPKANRDTRNVREKWLKGHRGEGPKAKGKGGKGAGRKVERKGFGIRGFVRDE